MSLWSKFCPGSLSIKRFSDAEIYIILFGEVREKVIFISIKNCLLRTRRGGLKEALR